MTSPPGVPTPSGAVLRHPLKGYLDEFYPRLLNTTMLVRFSRPGILNLSRSGKTFPCALVRSINRKVIVIKRLEDTAYNFLTMSTNPNEEYMVRCQNTMRQKYGESVYILIAHKADPEIYPNGAWFDEYVNQPMKVAGVDEDNNPGLYILLDGNSVPFSCAELLTWTPPVIRSKELVTLVDEMSQKKRTPSQREVLALLKLTFREIPDDAELIIAQCSPFLFADGTILWLEEHRYQIDDYMVLFVAGIHKVKEGKVYAVALDHGKGNCISLTRATRFT